MNRIELVEGEGPPPEAYSRITNPERFEPLLRVAMDQVERLEREFDIERVDCFGLDPDLERADLTRASINLIPADSTAASILIAFTSFPAVIVRSGLLLDLTFPECGCDACGATAEAEVQRLTEVIEDVVSGRFRESIRIPLWGDAEETWELWSPTHRRGGGVRIARSRARALVARSSQTFEWSAWPLR
jgi:hypothetical protein